MDVKWPLLLLVGSAAVVGVGVVVGLLVLVQLSPLPAFFKGFLDVALIGFLVPSANVARSRFRDGRHPWAKDRPERG